LFTCYTDYTGLGVVVGERWRRPQTIPNDETVRVIRFSPSHVDNIIWPITRLNQASIPHLNTPSLHRNCQEVDGRWIDGYVSVIITCKIFEIMNKIIIYFTSKWPMKNDRFIFVQSCAQWIIIMYKCVLFEIFTGCSVAFYCEWKQ